MRLKLLGWIVMVVAVSLVAACGNDAAETGGSSAPAPTASASAEGSPDSKVLHVRFYDDPAGFDPTNIFRIENEVIAYNIFSGLVTYDGESGEIVPDLAESWETTDNQTWTFHLREGVQWQQGYGEFTAADVLYTYNRIMDPEIGSPYAIELADIVRLEAPDDYTVEIELSAPNGNFLHTVANHHQGQILKQEAVEAAGDLLAFSPVGTGPYYLERLDMNSEIVLARHEDYYRGLAPIEKIVFSIIKDETTARIALQNGEVDLVMRSQQEENLEILENEGYLMNHTMNRNILNFVFNMDTPYLSDVRVRQAWAHAIDKVAVSQAIAPRLEGEAHNIIPDWMDVYSDKIPRYDYDPDKARALLEDAGYGDGITIKMLQTASVGVTPQYQLIQEYLQAVGIQLDFELVDTPTFNARRNAGDFETTIRSIPAINPDMVLFSFLHSDQISPAGLNGARYNNPELVEKLEAAKGETDPATRMKLYEEVQVMAMTDMPYWPSHGINIFWPGKPNVTGVNINYLSLVDFYYVDIE